jgi:transposase
VNKYTEKFIKDRDNKVNEIIGKELSKSEFYHQLIERKGKKYSIHNGWNVENIQELLSGKQTCIARGIITEVFCENNTIYVVLNDEKYPSEQFSADSIKKITVNKNNYYVVYNDNSYFKIVIE